MRGMEPAALLAAVCHTDRSDPFPLWQDGHVGSCFNQLVLGALPHAAMAVFSACYLSVLRSRPLHPTPPPCGWTLRLASSAAAALLFAADVAVASVLQQGELYLDLLADGCALLAWLVHLVAMVTLQRSVLMRTRGPPLLVLLVVLSIPHLVVTMMIYCLTPGYLDPAEPLKLSRLVLAAARALPLLLYLLAFAFPCVAGGDYALHVDAEDGPPLLGGGRPDTGAMVAEDGSGCVSRLFYLWLAPLLRRGRRGELERPADVYHLPRKLRTSVVRRYFHRCWEACRRGAELGERDQWPNPVGGASWSSSASAGHQGETLELEGDVGLLRVLHRAYGRRYYALGALKLLVNMLGFAGPLILSSLVTFMEGGAESGSWAGSGALCALGLFASTLLAALLRNVFVFQVSKVALSVRAALVTTIYGKALRVGGLSGFSTGEVVNLMSTDTERVINVFTSFHELWSLPFCFGIALYLLYLQVGVAFLGGLAVALLLVPLNKVIASRIVSNNREMLRWKDERVKLMTEILFGIRVIKFYAWEPHFAQKVATCRRRELSHLRAIKYLDALCVYTWAALPVVISILTFVTYTMLGHQLTAAKVFTTLALVGMLIIPLNSFPWVLNSLLESKVSLQRIQRFLKLTNQDLGAYYALVSPENNQTSVLLSQGTFSWQGPGAPGPGPETGIEAAAADKGAFVLQSLSLHVNKGSLVVVVGKVGCGKSSLLAAITGELSRLSGIVYVAQREAGLGLTCQEPWIQHASVRDNILFGKDLDPSFYQTVMEACALADDLNVLPHGDRTEVGENGVTLSGGQKARVALARAVYMNKDIYLLDDPLAAVDADVAQHLMQKCILGVLRGKTRILCTHRVEFVDRADVVVLMEGGAIVKTGSPAEVLPLVQVVPKNRKNEQNQREKGGPGSADQDPDREEPDSPVDLRVDDDPEQLGAEQKQAGGLAWSVYRTYWSAVGGALASAVLMSLLLMQASRNVSDWWLSHWISELSHNNSSGPNVSVPCDLVSSHLLLFSPGPLMTPPPRTPPPSGNVSSDVRFYLTVYASIAGANTVFTALRSVLFAYGGICAATRVHNRLLDHILKATVTFFDTTPLGRILNRFSSDLYSVDDSLPFILNILLANAFGLAGSLVVMGYGLPWVLVPLLPLALLYLRTQRYYRHTSRELKRLCSLTLSPVYSHFSETLSGLETIRASGSSARFEEENVRRLEQNQRCLFLSSASMQWLDVRLQLMGVAVVTGLAAIAVLQHHFHSVDPGLVGLSLSYALSITSLLSGLIFSLAQTEMQLVSVERTEEYSSGRLPTEPPGQHTQLSGAWPEHGALEYRRAVLSYRVGLPNALDGVSLVVRPGEKVGIVGRTGSGKSSLFLALFRMVELDQGQILLDGLDVGTVGLEQLRSRLAIIPQDPFLFSGTIRENLDPRGRHQDQELLDVLDQCHLRSVADRMGGLDADVGERGKLFSVGQKQLLCLCRALLTQAKVLCIDEATASVDQRTDTLLQETIRDKFRDKTVLTIAHRLNTIMDSDRVAVLHCGKVVEFDSPSVLCQRADSAFQRLVSAT